MPQLAWMIVCQKASVDKESNTVSLLEVADGIGLMGPEPPPDDFILAIHLELVSHWYRSSSEEPESPEARMRIFDPQGRPFGETVLIIDLANNRRFRSIVKSDGLRIRGTGIYFFVIEVVDSNRQWLEVGRIPFEVSFAPLGREAAG